MFNRYPTRKTKKKIYSNHAGCEFDAEQIGQKKIPEFL
jgi:hypothetical protein